jgi:serine/threonine-protein kinase
MSDIDWLGKLVGHVRVVDVLGHGGMGSVYVGYDEKLGRKVALKSIRDQDRLDPATRARFQREARTLSQLDHPNICRIYDYVEGEQADFLVLELIAGKSLKDVIREGKTSHEERLALAEQVASALALAHERGIIHRDLKPANIMVTDAGVAKVLDFGLARAARDQHAPALTVTDAGVAKVLDFGLARAARDQHAPTLSVTPGEPLASTPEARAESGYVVTQLGTLMGTLAYMSPEQARGEDVAPASDMYSLGLVLQELFTGQAPFDLGVPAPELLQQAREGRTRPVAGLDPDLTALLGRLKSIAPGARPSARDTLERIRWIRSAPARRRKKRLAVTAFAALAVLAAGLGVASWRANREAARANREAETARRISEFLVDLFKTSDPGRSRGNVVTARELLDAGARRLDTELSDQPRIQARLLDTVGKVYMELGLYEQAQPLQERALKIRQATLGGEDPEVAESLAGLGILVGRRGDVERSAALLRQALGIQEKVLGPAHPRVAITLKALGVGARYRSDWAEADRLYRKALAILEKALGPEAPEVASTLNNLGVNARDLGDYMEAERLCRKALAIREKALGPDHPDLADTLNNLGVIASSGRSDYVEADRLYRRALAIREKAIGPDSLAVGEVLNNLGVNARDLGDYAEADHLYRRSLVIRERVLGPDHPAVSDILHNLGVDACERGEYTEAERLFRRSLAIQEKALGPDHPDLATTASELGWTLRNQGRDREAEQILSRAFRALEGSSYGPGHELTLEVAVNLSDVLRRRGQPSEALGLALRAMEAVKKADPSSQERLSAAHAALEAGLIAQARGDHPGAVKLWEEGLSRDLERLLMPRGPSVKASLLLLLGRPAEARPLLSPAALAYDVELAVRAKQQGLSAVGPSGSQAEAR